MVSHDSQKFIHITEIFCFQPLISIITLLPARIAFSASTSCFSDVGLHAGNQSNQPPDLQQIITINKQNKSTNEQT